MSQRKAIAPVERYSYKDALRAKGILPLPPYSALRTAHVGAVEIFDPAIAKRGMKSLHSAARGETSKRSAT